MNEVLEYILGRDEFTRRPPLCVDLGASGRLPAEWVMLARNSVCLAFDADDRDFSSEEELDGDWRRLIKINRLVSSESSELKKFYLTKSPYCSSSLAPRNDSLQSWEFRDLFEIESCVELPAVSLTDVLRDLSIDYIDWFKSDTQGTDLRLFAALPEHIRRGVLAADFEPGIIDAYHGEDKLHHLLRYMEDLPFFVSDMEIKGSRRIGRESEGLLGDGLKDHYVSSLRLSPGWAEICYLNDLSGESQTIRDLMLAWVIATIKSQYGHALLAAEVGTRRFQDPIFRRCEASSLNSIRSSNLNTTKVSVRSSIVEKFRRRLATWIMPRS